MTLTKSGAEHQELFARVLHGWAVDGQTNAGSRGALAPYLDNMPVFHSTLSLLRKGTPSDMLDGNHWIVGRPVETHEGNLFPVASGAVKEENGHLMGTVRVALMQLDKAGVLRASGLRFECAEVNEDEKPPKPHTYPHTQPTNSWRMNGVCLLHPDEVAQPGADGCPMCALEGEYGQPTRTEHFNAHKPAIPLRCETLPGLAVNALASVYGAVICREILDSDTKLGPGSCPVEVGLDFDHVLGEDGKAGFPL